MRKAILKRDFLSIFLYVVIILSAAVLIRHFVVQSTLVDGHSMEDTLRDGDQLIIDKVSHQIGELKRFDIVVFSYRYDRDTYYIKRIIGLPGETVFISGNTIYIDGEPLEEDYGKEAMEEDSAGLASEELTLAADEFFVLGDNRNNSADSRSEDVGPIKREEIVGRALLRIWPVEDFGFLQR